MKGLKRTLADFVRHPWLHVLSISTICFSLFLLGIFFLLYRNFENVVKQTEPERTGTVYLQDGLTRNDIDHLRSQLLFLEGVVSAEFQSKQAVMKSLEDFIGSESNSEVAEGLFPSLIEIKLASEMASSQTDTLASRIRLFEGVSDVDFSTDVLAQYHRIKRVWKIVGVTLAVFLVLGCAFLTANFMGMRQHARRRELDVLSLVGAGKTYAFVPLFWEGMFEGLIAAVLSVGFVFLAKLGFQSVSEGSWLASFGIEKWLFLSSVQMSGLIVLGMVMAFLGSLTVFFRFDPK